MANFYMFASSSTVFGLLNTDGTIRKTNSSLDYTFGAFKVPGEDAFIVGGFDGDIYKLNKDGTIIAEDIYTTEFTTIPRVRPVVVPDTNLIVMASNSGGANGTGQFGIINPTSLAVTVVDAPAAVAVLLPSSSRPLVHVTATDITFINSLDMNNLTRVRINYSGVIQANDALAVGAGTNISAVNGGAIYPDQTVVLLGNDTGAVPVALAWNAAGTWIGRVDATGDTQSSFNYGVHAPMGTIVPFASTNAADLKVWEFNGTAFSGPTTLVGRGANRPAGQFNYDSVSGLAYFIDNTIEDVKAFNPTTKAITDIVVPEASLLPNNLEDVWVFDATPTSISLTVTNDGVNGTNMMHAYEESPFALMESKAAVAGSVSFSFLTTTPKVVIAESGDSKQWKISSNLIPA